MTNNSFIRMQGEQSGNSVALGILCGRECYDVVNSCKETWMNIDDGFFPSCGYRY